MSKLSARVLREKERERDRRKNETKKWGEKDRWDMGKNCRSHQDEIFDLFNLDVALTGITVK